MTTRRQFVRWALAAPAWAALGCDAVTSSATTPDRVSTRIRPNGDGRVPPKPSTRPPRTPQPPPPTDAIPAVGARLELTDAQWRERLTPAQYEILRDRGTENPWSGEYLKEERPGTYHCAACNNPLFSSETKYNSKTGWPSFWEPVAEGRVAETPDERFDKERTEVLCAHCDGHLGHVFDDGPDPTGLRYCVNSIALYLRPS